MKAKHAQQAERGSKIPLKAALIAAGTVTLVTLGSALVYAASSGEDFAWLATTDNGVRIGASGAQTPPAEDALEFAGETGEIWFGLEGGMNFGNLGYITAYHPENPAHIISMRAEHDDPDRIGVFMASTAPTDAEVSTMFMSVNSAAGLGAGVGGFEEDELVVEVHSSFLCTPEGNVEVGLGTIPQEEMQETAFTPSQGLYDRTMQFLGPAMEKLEALDAAE